MEDNKGQENNTNNPENKDDNNTNIETLTRDLIERDSEIAKLKKEKIELENAYKVLYERGNFNTQETQSKEAPEKVVTYDDILKRL
ncbi:hypothetical protein [Susfortunavirus gdyzp5]|uniref:Uncharacterized protein n=1 Tax=Clostridium phage vB_CP_qdyz_P5 TaxID=3003728 RepID=A0AAE9VGM8_9CAUD|nr:hypothetical protein [Clostridium phage vB_CP_qdyz_P5]